MMEDNERWDDVPGESPSRFGCFAVLPLAFVSVIVATVVFVWWLGRTWPL